MKLKYTKNATVQETIIIFNQLIGIKKLENVTKFQLNIIKLNPRGYKNTETWIVNTTVLMCDGMGCPEGWGTKNHISVIYILIYLYTYILI